MQTSHSTNSPLVFDKYLLDTPIGKLVICLNDKDLLQFMGWEEFQEKKIKQLKLLYGVKEITLKPSKQPNKVVQGITNYFEGDIKAIDKLAVAKFGTEFQQKVWQALRKIPAGTTTTYGELATQVGRPLASRAVGLANNRNPIPIVIPCHRVIGKNNKLTGYEGGLERKQ